MSSSAPVNQDPGLAPPATAPPAGPPAADPAASHVLDSTQVVQLLRSFPSVYQVSQRTSHPFPFLPFLLRAGCPCVYGSARAVSHMCNVRSSARLHVIQGEGHGWGTFASSQVPTPFFPLSVSILNGTGVRCLCYFNSSPRPSYSLNGVGKI
jgi:hypothetical protein